MVIAFPPRSYYSLELPKGLTAVIDTLILTDRDTFRELNASRLGEYQISPSWKSTVQDALNEFDRHVFHAIVVDFDSSGFKGSESCERILAANQLAPIVAIADDVTSSSIAGALESSVYDVASTQSGASLLAKRIRAAVYSMRVPLELQRIIHEAHKLLPRSVANSLASHEQPDRAPFIVHSLKRDTFLPMEEIEAKYVQYVLDCVDGNQSQAARILGLSRKTLWRRLRGRVRDSDEES